MTFYHVRYCNVMFQAVGHYVAAPIRKSYRNKSQRRDIFIMRKIFIKKFRSGLQQTLSSEVIIAAHLLEQNRFNIRQILN